MSNYLCRGCKMEFATIDEYYAHLEAAHNIPPPRDPLLAAREHTYGLFEHQGAFAYELKVFLRNSSGYENLRKDQREALDMIATKISRLLHGDPKTKDTWADIAGYAKLGEEACE